MREAQKKLIKTIKTDVESRFLKINKYNIHYIVCGEGAPLLLLHGLNIGLGQWHSNIAELAKHFKIYAPDLPGSGLSTNVNYDNLNIEMDFVDVIEAFITKLNLKNINLMGHSLGGWIILKLALKSNNIKKIILVDSLGFSNYVPWKHKLISIYAVAKFLSRTFAKPTKKKVEDFIYSFTYAKQNIKEEFINYFYEAISFHGNHPFMLINRLTRFFKIRKELLLVNELHQIKNPTLIIMGDKDRLIKLKHVEKNYKLIPNAKLEIFLNTGHTPFIEKSDKFNQLVINFLKS